MAIIIYLIKINRKEYLNNESFLFIYLKKQRASSSSISSKYSSVLKTEWFPINVLPSYVPKEIQVRNDPCNRPSEDDDDSEHLLFNRNNPFLQGESCQKVNALVCPKL